MGEGGYLQTNQLAFNFAYNLSLGNSYLALGSKLGYFNSSTDLEGLTTGSQFTGADVYPWCKYFNRRNRNQPCKSKD